jgi:hypothetical protein
LIRADNLMNEWVMVLTLLVAALGSIVVWMLFGKRP